MRSLASRSRLLVGLGLALVACQRPRVADPGNVLSAYAEAARRGDSEAIYQLLSERSQRDLGREGTRRLVEDARKELAAQADFLGRAGTRPEAVAVIQYDDGERAALALEEGVFRVSATAALPAAARTPADALAGLRKALARRSYAALVRVLSEQTRSALEADVAALVLGLEDPETLDVQVEGDRAEVDLPGGHQVKLRLEGGIWRVEDLK